MNDDTAGNIEPTLARFTGYLLYRAFVRAQACGMAAMPPGRHPRDLAILTALIEQGPASQARLGELLKINRTIMVKVVDGLEEAGLLRRARDPDDRRRYALAPTAEGVAALATLRRGASDGEDALAAGLTPAERSRLNELLLPFVVDLIVGLPDAVTNRTGFLLAHFHYRLREQGSQALRSLGIEPRHFGILTALDAAEPCSQQRLADRMGVSGPAIVQTVDELDRGALILRDRNPADRREHVLSLTEQGRRSLAQARGTLDDIQRQIDDRLTKAGTADLNALLIKVATGAG